MLKIDNFEENKNAQNNLKSIKNVYKALLENINFFIFDEKEKSSLIHYKNFV